MKMQQDSQSPNQNQAPPSKSKDEQSPPPELQIGHTKENLLKQVVDDSPDPHKVSIPKTEEKWP